MVEHHILNSVKQLSKRLCNITMQGFFLTQIGYRKHNVKFVRERWDLKNWWSCAIFFTELENFTLSSPNVTDDGKVAVETGGTVFFNTTFVKGNQANVYYKWVVFNVNGGKKNADWFQVIELHKKWISEGQLHLLHICIRAGIRSWITSSNFFERNFIFIRRRNLS